MTDAGLTYAYRKTRGEHIWSVVGPDGGIHINAFRWPGARRWSGGVETHRRQPPEGVTRPGRPDCWLTGGPCWHDGTSLYFSESIAPWFEDETEPFSDELHGNIRAELTYWYRRLTE